MLRKSKIQFPEIINTLSLFDLSQHNHSEKIKGILRKFTQYFPSDIEKNDYELWIQQNEPYKKSLKFLKTESRNFKYHPKISIFTLVWNSDGKWLKMAVESLLDQVYENWELFIVCCGQIEPRVDQIIREYGRKDQRVKVILNEYKGAADNLNDAISLSSGEFAGFLGQKDELSPFALYEVVRLLKIKDTDYIYSDEDKIYTDGIRYDPYFKPDWSPDLFLSTMYTGRFGIFRKKIIEEIGGFRKGFEGNDNYDMVLRFTEITDKIYHIPGILYHSRKIQALTPDHVTNYAEINAKKSLEDALKRRKIDGEVLSGRFPGSFNIQRKIIDEPFVSIIIPTRDQVETLRKCIDSIHKKTTYKNYEIIIVDNNSVEILTFKYFESISKSPGVKLVKYQEPFNFAAINNFAARHSNGEYLLFLNNDTEVISRDWLTVLLGHAQRNDVGAVGCKLLYPDGKIQHAGIIIGIKGVAVDSHKYLHKDDPGYFGMPHLTQDVSAVTAACIMMRKKVFEEVDGFDENLAVAFNDIDLCLKIREKGYLIVYTPFAELYHHESLSRGYENTPEKLERLLKEAKYLRDRWGEVIDKGDPYYNPNLTLEAEDFSIRINRNK